MRALRPWLPAIVWALLISGASTDALSAEHTGELILPVLHALLPAASTETIGQLHWLVRKAAHFGEYFVFGILLWRGVRGKRRGWQPSWAVIALAIAASYSLLDEYHQSFVASRTATPWDSLLDTLAAGTALVVLRYRAGGRTARARRSPASCAGDR